MGYDLHITRKECWAEEEDNGTISLAEWKSYVENDPEIIPDPENPHEDNYLYIRENENWPLWFNPRLSEIYTKNPPDDVINKIIKISVDLKARVQGDDQEFYDFSVLAQSEQKIEPLSNESNNAKSHDRYVWYFCAIVFVLSIVWHIFIPGK